MNGSSPSSPPLVYLPISTEGVAYFVDEAGSKGTLGKHFVTAAVRTTDPDKLSRAIKACRDRNNFTKADEIKFSKVNKNSEPILAELFSEAVASGCKFGAFVLDKRHFDPWSSRNQWQGHLFATDRLLRGLITRREVSVVMLDHIDVPQGVSYGDELATSLNSRFGNKRVISAVSLDSRTCPALQIADLLASAVFHARKKIEDHGLEKFLEDRTPKARLAKDIASTLGETHFADCRTDILRLQTSHEKSLTELNRRHMI
ncbi:DUF3800 domain-containing protein [Corynebacterium pseudodiphtheriticum]|uniref:DUF3800 domain-containing protein n=1 Tax=Corynebacterium pseudodiphtheriticum TaxID=37637 RepID=UPI0020BFD0C1|nr:DUF3800 domain-containing protein [Corynebacterium pseudodiphtheriticum]MDK8477788.1 DUF3800 domain-containing protein [Corynebacterium pseudodiphtheriticum]MDK8499684.1 DUF3800 domain-containing protein [Corynebacterium pseudodiphtheriticum]MDK8545225.1 DUF3800 domain-containing protein [Corynebacterium pseudodiphtheriticum]MDK8550798.1 DUF3800 domain-containing protein [Corynebacterium pseudodiphtheriticum]MDK8577247.1 DUF3800 domain-containing protein [Corynebacterium pseudodiphtheriticu